MGLTEYFKRTGYQAQYHLGDRVTGLYQGRRFMGTVGNDRLVNPITGPEVVVHLDLPLRIDGQTHRLLVLQHQDIRPLKRFDQL